MLNSPLNPEISKYDIIALSSLVNIELVKIIAVLNSSEIFEDDTDAAAKDDTTATTEEDDTKTIKEGFELIFHFTENSHFTNPELRVQFTKDKKDQSEIIGDNICWKEGFLIDLTRVPVNKAYKPPTASPKVTHHIVNKEKMEVEEMPSHRSFIKTEFVSSFFNLFEDVVHHKGKTVDGKTVIDQEMTEEIDFQLIQKFEIGEKIRDVIIPHAVSWYTGEAVHGEAVEDFDERIEALKSSRVSKPNWKAVSMRRNQSLNKSMRLFVLRFTIREMNILNKFLISGWMPCGERIFLQIISQNATRKLCYIFKMLDASRLPTVSS